MSPIRTILHPTDFSEPAEAAFSLAAMLARTHGARVVVLHVYPPPINQHEAVARRHDGSYEADQWRLLDQYQAPDPTTLVEHQLAEGDPAEEILRVARVEGCDLIVMGTQGRGGLPRLLIGSVADKVMRRANCSVLTVRTPAAAKAA
jgi:nucleotide-binding universal stress UspA family protein